MKVRLLTLLVALLLPTVVMAEGWYGKFNKESELGRAPFSVAKIPVFENVEFAFNKSIVQPKYIGIIDQAYSALETDPHLRASLQGHTDNIGSEPYNMKLSKARAEAVELYFTDRGVASHRIELGWHGEMLPIASNATASGRQENRRTSITLFKRDVMKDLQEDLQLEK
ncbi:MAG TPA: OmpA family protein [Bdellovibrionota bacterium]|nr:OmpA family protein [Bdellovibrionota bacterium]